MGTVAVFPGTFDPITYGHVDVIQRGSRVFEHVIVAVARSELKKPLFTLQERISMIRPLVKKFPNVEVEGFDGATVAYVRRKKADVILRGIRTVSDFETEFQMALTNRAIDQEVETLFVMASERFSFIRTQIIKEAVMAGADVSALVPPTVHRRLREKLGPSSSRPRS